MLKLVTSFKKTIHTEKDDEATDLFNSEYHDAMGCTSNGYPPVNCFTYPDWQNWHLRKYPQNLVLEVFNFKLRVTRVSEVHLTRLLRIMFSKEPQHINGQKIV